MQVQSLGQEGPLEEGVAAHSSALAWISHGQRSLVGNSPWGRKESDTTEHTHIGGGAVDQGPADGRTHPELLLLPFLFQPGKRLWSAVVGAVPVGPTVESRR